MHIQTENKQLYQTWQSEIVFSLFYVVLGHCNCSNCQCRLSLFDPKQLLGVGMHYLNDPLCFSQSGGCRRLINLTCLLFCTQWGQTHIAYSKPALGNPPFYPLPIRFADPVTICAPFLGHQIIIQIDEIVIYANERNMEQWFVHD